ncbi:MAG: Lrp/AsnC ligand binding domain-containing protein [Thermoproteota archaeon]
MIECDDKATNDVADELKKMDSVIEYVKLDSTWKIIIKLEGDLEHIRDIIRWKIRKMSNIKSTLTRIEYMN